VQEGSTEALALLTRAQAALRGRFDEFRRALDRRDDEAYRVALADFHERLAAWTAAEERALLPALDRARLADRSPRHELRLEYVQLRELTAHLRREVEGGGRLSDVLGFVENLSRRLAAHEMGNAEVYYPAAADRLTEEERNALQGAAPPD
jgi:hypothetical protein